jgi:hypothetical protein
MRRHGIIINRPSKNGAGFAVKNDEDLCAPDPDNAYMGYLKGYHYQSLNLRRFSFWEPAV